MHPALTVLTIVLWLAASSLALDAQQQPTIGLLRADDPRLAMRCTDDGPDTLVFVMVEPNRSVRSAGSMVRHRTTVRRQGDSACVVVQRYRRPAGTDTDSSFMSFRGFTPVSYRARVGAARHDFRFFTDSAVGTVQAPDSTPRTIVHRTEHPYFLAVADLEILRALALTEGLRFEVELYNPPMGFRRATVRVEGVDTVLVAGRATPAWRVGYDAGAAPTVLWLRRGDRRLLRSRSSLPNGAIFWRILAPDSLP
jgi:hypothetical protein